MEILDKMINIILGILDLRDKNNQSQEIPYTEVPLYLIFANFLKFL